MTPLTQLKGQEAKVAQALTKHGYLDKEYALTVLKVRNVAEIVRRLRGKGWNIVTNSDEIERLYTLQRSLNADVRVLTSAINGALGAQELDRAYKASRLLTRRLAEEVKAA